MPFGRRLKPELPLNQREPQAKPFGFKGKVRYKVRSKYYKKQILQGLQIRWFESFALRRLCYPNGLPSDYLNFETEGYSDYHWITRATLRFVTEGYSDYR